MNQEIDNLSLRTTNKNVKGNSKTNSKRKLATAEKKRATKENMNRAPGITKMA